MSNKLIALVSSTVLFTGSAFAGEIGVTNSYGHSFRNGTGTTNIEWRTNSQTTEQTSYGAIKLETSAYNQNNGWGNGDQDPPGNSGPNNNAENGGGGSPFSDRAFAASLVFGSRNYTDETRVNGSTAETYSFGSTNFTHSVGAFSR